MIEKDCNGWRRLQWLKKIVIIEKFMLVLR